MIPNHTERYLNGPFPELEDLLRENGVEFERVSESERQAWERDRRALYHDAFQCSRCLRQCAAAHAYRLEDPGGYAILPLRSGVPGTPVAPVRSSHAGYYVEGPLVALDDRPGGELCVVPHQDSPGRGGAGVAAGDALPPRAPRRNARKIT